jgi:HEAT repeat protein
MDFLEYRFDADCEIDDFMLAIQTVKMPSKIAKTLEQALIKKLMEGQLRGSLMENLFHSADAARALGLLPDRSKQAVDSLLKGLSNQNRLIRFRCVQALGRIGPDDKKVHRALAQVAKDDISPIIRESATWAVSRIEERIKEISAGK